MDVIAEVDPRLQGELRAELARRQGAREEPIPRGVTVVLCGHRGAGKSRLLPHVAQLLGREGVDLDQRIEQRTGRSIRELFSSDPLLFRQLERETFRSLPRGLVVAVGGGFLSSHADALRGCLRVLVPVTFETYRERLQGDTTRPRLRPDVDPEVEWREVYFEREELHRASRPMSLVDLVLKAREGARARRVVTLPPGADPWAFTWEARHRGAELLEVRTDLTPPTLDLRSALRGLPLLVSERGPAAPDAWLELAELVDRPLGTAPSPMLSFHAEAPMRTADVVNLWRGVPPGTFVKHVEPLGALEDARRLFATRDALAREHGTDLVTVLATGPGATAFRAVLAQDNAHDFLALDAEFHAAPGQRLLADAVRQYTRPGGVRHDGRTQRLAIVGSAVGRSRSPRLHAQPFDRLELPRDVKLETFLEVVRPHYRGFAVTAPFKKPAAKAVHATHRAVNTLVRTPTGWEGHNTDVLGAKATLEALGAKQVTVLGDGGTTEALREAAGELGVTLDVRVRAGGFPKPLSGAVVWTWPADVEVPEALRFERATVAVIVYGAPALLIAEEVRGRGGVPRLLGARWFIAQAREQRRLWENVT